MNLKNFKKEFDPLLFASINIKIKSFEKYKNRELINNLLHLRKLIENGKRLRPYLAFLTYKSYGGKKEKEALNLLVFIEIFHAFCLVHDDIMDDARQRHGVKTIQNLPTSSQLGNSIAILIGDFLFNWAFDILLKNKDFDKDKLEKITNIFLKMADEVITGQFIDINLTSKDSSSENEIYQKMFLKTASYSFINPMMIGSALAGNENEKFIKNFGKEIGISFQIQDDLFDIVFDEKQLNKTAFNDIEQNQHTMFTNYVFEKGTNEQKKILKNQMGQKIQQGDKKKLRDVFLKSGAIKYGQSLIEANIRKARIILENEKINIENKKHFSNFIELINQRTS